MDRIDCAIVGAGIIGIAAARALARAGREVLIIERERQFGTGISSRSSEVIHAGIYYPTGSLKAQLCLEGRQALYDYCAARGIAHRRCGKLIVATDTAQEAELDRLLDQAESNGVDDLERLTASEASALEPEVRCTQALLSPSTGIVDTHALMLALLGEAEELRAVTAYGAEVSRVERRADGWAVWIAGEAEGPSVVAGCLVNAAGLDAPAFARSVVGLGAQHVPEAHLAKGSYFGLAGRSPFSRLVYPVPEPGGLGIHATIDLAGRTRFGPDVEWCESPDYRVDPARAERFYAGIRRYWPGLADGTLTPDYCGIRPKIAGPGEPAADFSIEGPPDHGLPGLVNLFGIESPGLTAALAIADRVAALLR
jgi:L-2-hydroxyglutarate oxidase LhgO